jgi:ligand-binding SRPBCC domain-containing protein
MVHQLGREQTIPADVSAVWAFFATPRNLNALTPPSLHFQLLGEPLPMHAGQMLSYRIRVAPLVRLRWLTEIVHVEPGRYFVDEQRIGPYRLWHHEHHFAETSGGTRMVDRVTYALPLGVVGDLIHAVWVRRQLRYIFDYRAARVRDLFPVQASEAPNRTQVPPP